MSISAVRMTAQIVNFWIQIVVMNCGMIDSHCGKYKHVKEFNTTVCIKEFTIRVTIHISDVSHWGWEL